MPKTTMIEDAIILNVTFSLRKRLDIKEANTGEDELSDVALEAPMSWTLNRKAIPPSVIPSIPEVAKNT